MKDNKYILTKLNIIISAILVLGISILNQLIDVDVIQFKIQDITIPRLVLLTPIALIALLSLIIKEDTYSISSLLLLTPFTGLKISDSQIDLIIIYSFLGVITLGTIIHSIRFGLKFHLGSFTFSLISIFLAIGLSGLQENNKELESTLLLIIGLVLTLWFYLFFSMSNKMHSFKDFAFLAFVLGLMIVSEYLFVHYYINLIKINVSIFSNLIQLSSAILLCFVIACYYLMTPQSVGSEIISLIALVFNGLVGCIAIVICNVNSLMIILSLVFILILGLCNAKNRVLFVINYVLLIASMGGWFYLIHILEIDYVVILDYIKCGYGLLKDETLKIIDDVNKLIECGDYLVFGRGVSIIPYEDIKNSYYLFFKYCGIVGLGLFILFLFERYYKLFRTRSRESILLAIAFIATGLGVIYASCYFSYYFLFVLAFIYANIESDVNERILCEMGSLDE